MLYRIIVRKGEGLYERKIYGKNSIFKTALVVNTLYWNISCLYFGTFIWGLVMLRHFMRYKFGWWILHTVAILLTFYLGKIVKF